MANNADGSIIIDTELDNSGFQRGSRKMQNSINSLNNSANQAGRNMAESIQAVTPALREVVRQAAQSGQEIANNLGSGGFAQAMAEMQKQAGSISSQLSRLGDTETLGVKTEAQMARFAMNVTKARDSLALLIGQLNRFTDVPINTAEYERLQAEYERLDAALTKLYEKQELMQQLGVKESSTSYQRLALQIDKVGESAEDALQRVSELQRSGEYAQMGGDTAQYQEMTEIIRGLATQLEHYEEVVNSFSGTNLPSGLDDMPQQANEATEALRETDNELQQKPKDASAASKAFSFLGHSLLNVSSIIPRIGWTAISNGAKMAGKGITGLIDKMKHLHNQSGKNILTNNGLVKSLFSVKRMLLSRIKRTFISSLFNSMKEGMHSFAKYSSAFNAAMSGMKNSMTGLSGNLAVAAGNLVSAIAPAIITIIDWISKAITYFNAFMALLSGRSTYTVAQNGTDDYAESLDKTKKSASGASKAVKDLKNQVYGFDELNRKDDPNSGGGGADDSGIRFVEKSIDSLPNALQDFMKKIKDAFNAEQFEEIGAIIGNGLNRILTTIDDWVNQKARPMAVKWSANIARILNGLIPSIDWSRVGKTIADGLNTITDTLNTFLTTFDITEAAKAFYTAINGLVDNIDWLLLGETVGKGINGLKIAVWGGLAGINWKQLGSKLASSVNKMFASVDWGLHARNISAAVKGALDGITQLLSDTDWQAIGTDIVTFINNIDWGGLAVSLVSGVGTVISSAIELIKTTVTGLKWSEIGAAIDKALNGIDLVKWTNGLGKSLSGLGIGLYNTISSFIKSVNWANLAKQLWNAIYNFLAEVDYKGLLSSWAEYVGAILGAAVGILTGLGEKIWELIKSAWEVTKTYFSEYFGAYGGDIIAGLFAGIINALKGVAGWVHKNIIKPLISSLESALGLEQGTIAVTAIRLWNDFTTWIKKAWNEISGVVSEFFTDVWNTITGFFGTLGDTASGIWTGFKENLISGWNAITGEIGQTLSSAWESIKGFFGNLGDTASGIWAGFKENIAAGWNAITGEIGQTLSGAWASIKGFFGNLGDTASGIWTGFKENIASGWNAIAGDISQTLSSAWASIKGFFGNLGDTASGIWTGFKENITSGWNAIVGEIGQTLSGAWGAITGAFGNLGEVASSIWTGFKENLISGWNAISEEIGQLLSGVWASITGYFGNLGEVASSIWTGFKENLISGWNAITGEIGQTLSGAWASITGYFGNLGATASGIWTGFKENLSAGWNQISGDIGQVLSDAWESIKGAFTNFGDIATNLWDGLKTGLVNGWNKLKDDILKPFKDMWQSVKDFFGIASPSTEAASIGDFILQGLVSGFSAAIEGVITTVKNIFGRIWDAIKSIFGFGSESEESKDAKQAGQDIMTGMTNGIKGDEDKTKKAIRDAAQHVLETLRQELGIPGTSGASTKTKAYGESIVTGLKNGIESKGVAATFTSAAEKVAEATLEALNSAFGVDTSLFSTSSAASKFKAPGENIVLGVNEGINGKASKGTFTTTTDAVMKVLKDAFNSSFGLSNENSVSGKLKYVGQNILYGIRDGISEKAVEGTFTNAANSIFSAVASALNTSFAVKGGGWGASAYSEKFLDIGKAICQGVANGVSNNTHIIQSGAISSIGQVIAQSIVEQLNSEKSTINMDVFIGIGKSVCDSIAKGITDNVNTIKTAITTAETKVSAAITTLAQSVVKSAVKILNSGEGKAIGSTFIEELLGGISSVHENIVQQMETTGDAVQKAASGKLASNEGKRIGTSFLNGILLGLNSLRSSLTSTVQNMANDAYSAFSGLLTYSAGYSMGAQICNGIISGLYKYSSYVSAAAWYVALVALDAARAALGIASPSKAFAEIGGYMMQGMENGLNNGRQDVTRTVSNIAEGIVNGLSDTPSVKVATDTLVTGLDGTVEKLSTVAELFQSIADAITSIGGLNLPAVASGAFTPYKVRVSDTDGLESDTDRLNTFTRNFDETMSDQRDVLKDILNAILNLDLNIDAKALERALASVQHDRIRAFGGA